MGMFEIPFLISGAVQVADLQLNAQEVALLG